MIDCRANLSVAVDDAIQVREQLANTEIRLAVMDIEVDASGSFKLPLDQMAALGGLGSVRFQLCSAPSQRRSTRPLCCKLRTSSAILLTRPCRNDSRMVQGCSAPLEMQLLASDRLGSTK